MSQHISFTCLLSSRGTKSNSSIACVESDKSQGHVSTASTLLQTLAATVSAIQLNLQNPTIAAQSISQFKSFCREPAVTVLHKMLLVILLDEAALLAISPKLEPLSCPTQTAHAERVSYSCSVLHPMHSRATGIRQHASPPW